MSKIAIDEIFEKDPKSFDEHFKDSVKKDLQNQYFLNKQDQDQKFNTFIDENKKLFENLESVQEKNKQVMHNYENQRYNMFLKEI